jgi:hypothetical protein
MARPTKQGVDYFPLDVHLDDKFKFIEIKYKLEGFAIVIKIMQKIYSCGYWYKWTDDEALLFSDEVRADYDLVTEVINECLDRDVFNKELHEKYCILTSKGIQKRYKEMVRRRKEVEVTEEYLLIDNILTVNDDINTTSRRHDDSKSTQSKVNKTKVKKINNYTDQFENWWSYYPRQVEKKKSFNAFEKALVNHSFEVLLNGAKGYADHIKKSGTDEKFVKHPTTFLNGESFIDYQPKQKKESRLKGVDPELIQKLIRRDQVAELMDQAKTDEEYRKLADEWEQLQKEVG